MSLINAALRPSGNSYRDKLIAKEFHKNPSEEIDELLKDNLGYLVYQEDTIKFLTDICGFSGSLADTTRRAIGKKDIELLNEQLPKILEGYCNNSKKPRHIAEQEAKEFIQIIDDSSEYQFGFNHSTGYSKNGFMCVRLRTYHPIEFLTAYLNRSENDEDIAMGTKLAKELNIKIRPARFGKSRGDYVFDKNDNTIYKGIASIKNLSYDVAEELYLLKDNVYNNFFDLLKDIKQKTTCNATKLDTLIKVNFFKEFGSPKYLLECVKIFNELKNGNAKQITIEKAQKLNIPLEIFDRYARLSDSGKTYLDINVDGLLKEINEYLQCTIKEEFSIIEKIQFQQDFLGYVDIATNEENDRRKLVVLNIRPLTSKKTKKIWAYSCETMSLGSGKTSSVTIGSYDFDKQPIEKYSIIYAKKLEKKNNYWWVTSYYIVD